MHLEFIILPLVLNTRSDGELVAHTDKYFFASCDNTGKLV